MIALIEVHSATYEPVDGKTDKVKGSLIRIAPQYIQAIQEAGFDCTSVMFGNFWHIIYEPIQQVMALLRSAGS